jgi:hypothetical protein
MTVRENRRRISTIATPVVLVVLLGLLAIGVWWGYKAVTAPLPKLPPPSCAPVTVGPVLTPSSVQVRVLNGGTKNGLAATVAGNLHDVGFPIPKFGNKSDYGQQQTSIVGFSADSPEVVLVAGFFPDAVIAPDGRIDHSVDVIVSDGYAGFNGEAPREVPVADPNGVVCLPAASNTPTPEAAPEGEAATEEEGEAAPA